MPQPHVSTEAPYLPRHRSLPAIGVGEDVALPHIDLQQVDAVGRVDHVDEGGFVHQKLGGNVSGSGGGGRVHSESIRAQNEQHNCSAWGKKTGPVFQSDKAPKF